MRPKIHSNTLVQELCDYTYNKYNKVVIETDVPNTYAIRMNQRYNIDPYDCELVLTLHLDKKTVQFEDLFDITKESTTYQKGVVDWLGNKEQYTIPVNSVSVDDWKIAIDKMINEVIDNPEIKNHLVSQFS